MGDRLTPVARFEGIWPTKRAEQFIKVEAGFARCFEVAFMTRQTHASLFSACG